MDIPALSQTDFSFPGQTGIYHGKVRDVYTVGGDMLISVATDRISAFDKVLPRPIPYKGQVLNQLAAYFLKATNDIVPNWLKAVPDPNVGVGIKAEPVKIEVVVRNVLVGHAWREYKGGAREICGIPLPDGLKEYDTLPEPIITPTTKADEGHDKDISEADILSRNLVSAADWQSIKKHALELFGRGQDMAKARGLVLADTKYEFGRADGKLILIDEVHTPDSSRYFYADSYDGYIAGRSDEKPRHLSKEFVREWLVSQGFAGVGEPPEMTDEFIRDVSERYLEIYEKMTGQTLVKAEGSDIIQRIEGNVINYLQEHSA